MSAAWRIVFRRTGGPEVLEREAMALPEPGPGEARIRHGAIGVNFIDTYHRSGLYPLDLPSGLGVEAAGTVEAVGAGVTAVRPGQRVAYLPRKPTTYATHGIAEAATLLPLPDDIDDATAAAVLLKGVTAWMLVERCAKVQRGQTVLVHAAAGGVGSLLVPWLKAVGAIVIAHAGSPEKAAKAKALGADQALSCPFDALAHEVREHSAGHGADVVLDGVGAASWLASLGSLARRGLLVSYGNASGPVPPFSPLDLLRAGSAFVTRPTMYDYLDTAHARGEAARRLFRLLEAGTLQVDIGQRFPLAEAEQAHRALEGRQTTGSTVLIP
jgi:NADPH:quinone reductase